MKLEDCFEFLSQDDIRIKGTRIGIETILEDYLEGFSPEEIAIRYRNLSLGQVYATITYYLHTRTKIDAYLETWRRYTEQSEHGDNYISPELIPALEERIKNYQDTPVAETRTDYHIDNISTEIEYYFEFLDKTDIRIRGTRVGIETILDDYLEGASPEEIAARYRSLSLEQVYATITYYLYNRAEIDVYLKAWYQYVKQAEQLWEANPSEVAKRLHQLKVAGGVAH